VTGAGGFVGTALCRTLVARGHDVVGAVRRGRLALPGVATVEVGDVGPDTDWGAALAGVETVVHLAARVHVMNDRTGDPLAEYRRVNVDGSRRLAERAATAGVRRLVHVSSVKVHGDASLERPFTERDPAAPGDPYGISKAEAENAMAAVAAATGMDLVMVRPPLVYGPGVKGNFHTLVAALRRGLPLPLAGVVNRRSLIFVGNLADALALCAEHPAAAGETFLVRDGEDVSTPQLVRKLGKALGRPARLIAVPTGMVRLAAWLLGRSGAADRLFGSLAVDDAEIRRRLGWRPPFTLDEGLTRTVAEG